MTDLKISQLGPFSETDVVAGDVLPLADVSEQQTKKIAASDLVKAGARLNADTITFGNNVVVSGNFTVNGTTTTIDTTTLVVEDKNIEMGVVATPTDITANGGGITLKGTTDKTINWLDATDSWTSSENLDLASGKSYRINNVAVLSSTTLGSGVTGSSLTSVGTIGTGTWQGTAVGVLYGGTGQTSYTDGQLLIGNSSGNTLTKSTLTAGTGVTITNGNGSITISATGSGGTVTSVTASSPLASSGGTTPNISVQTDPTFTGTVTAPTLRVTGTTVPDNGVYLPAANTVAVSTNSTSRLTIASDGKVGIGITPSTFDSTASRGVLALDGGTSVALWAGVGGAAKATFQHDGTNSILYNVANGYLAFGTNNTERARISASGDFSTTGTSTAASFIPTSSTAPTNGVYLPATNSVAISTNGSGRVFVDSSGRVGAGTSTPTYRLDLSVSGSGTTLDGINLSNGTATGFFQTTGATYSYRGIGSNQTWIGSSGNQLNVGTSTNHPLSFSTNAFTALTIDTSQRVGIGSTSPSSTLTVGGNPPAAGAIGAVGASGGIALALSDNVNCSMYVRTASGGAVIGTDAGGVLRFATNGNAGTDEKARIDSSGRLLVGTSSAVTGANASISKLNVLGNSINSAGNAALVIGRGAAASTLSAGNDIGGIYFTDNGSNEFAAITCHADAATGAADAPGRLVFSTTADGASSPTERMRIGSNGDTYFLGSSSALSVAHTQSAGTIFNLIYGVHSATSTTGSGTLSFVVKTNGNVQNTNNSYGAISDIKLKENIVDAGSQWSDIKALQVRNYNFKEGQTHTQIGLVAQEVELVSPGLVSESPDRDEDGNDLGTVTKSVNYSVLYMKAVKALQEAMERIEQLEAKVAALESA